MTRIKLSVKAREHVRELLRNYNQIDRDIAMIRESVLYPYKETDTNIGGGRNNMISDGSDTIIKLLSHSQLRFKSKVVKCIDEVLAESSDEGKLIIECRYFADVPMNWVKISQLDKISYSPDNCKKIERAIVDEIGVKLGF